MNSLNYAQTINELQESLENYNDNSIFSTKIKKIEFFPSKHLFSTESYLKNVISVGSDHFFAEGIQEYFVKDEIIVAEVTSKEKTTLLCSKFQENNKVSIPMTSLTLSWQATNEMMDYLTGLIDPKAADSQPENLFIILKEEMKESIKKLNGVAALSEGWTSWTLKSISGYLGYTSTIKEEEELNDIKQLASILNSAFDTCRQYIRMASLSNKTSDQFIDDIVTFKNSLQNTYATLSSLQMQFAKEKLLKKSELINEILNYINSELALLPSDEISYDGYVKRISQALIWQSNEAKQISWKIRRYEEQISELTRLFELHLEDLLKKQTDWTASNCGLYESIIIEESAFSKTAEVIGGGIVNYLYNGLKEINDSTETTPTNVDNYYTQQRLDRVRGGYTKFLTIFRKSFDREMTKENPNPINMGTLQRIAVLLYTEINLYSELSDTLIQFNEMGAATLGQPLHEINSQAGKRVLSYAEQAKGLVGIQPVLSHNVKFHPEVQWIYTIYERIRAVPCGAKVRLLDGWINSAKGQWNRNFDPNMQSNPIHLLSTLEIDLGNGKIPKIIKMLGMGTVTKEDLYSVITLVPEFIAFIRGYKDSGKRHLYVNNQNMLPIGDDYISQALNGDETPRCKLIMGAQSLKDLKGALFAITLSKNSKFYRQEGPFKERYNAKSFTEELYEQVFVKTPKESGCYISPEIRDLLLGFNIDLNEKAKFIIEQIHTIFDKRISLTQEERKIFIELFYNKLTKVILIGGKFDSCNISCKDQIDRAAGSNAIAYAEDAIVNSENGNLTADDVEMIRILMLVRAIFVRKREPIQERVDRFCETYNFLLENMHAMKALHKQIFSNIRITPGPC